MILFVVIDEFLEHAIQDRRHREETLDCRTDIA